MQDALWLLLPLICEVRAAAVAFIVQEWQGAAEDGLHLTTQAYVLRVTSHECGKHVVWVQSNPSS